jgi:hypothetical protein
MQHIGLRAVSDWEQRNDGFRCAIDERHGAVADPVCRRHHLRAGVKGISPMRGHSARTAVTSSPAFAAAVSSAPSVGSPMMIQSPRVWLAGGTRWASLQSTASTGDLPHGLRFV